MANIRAYISVFVLAALLSGRPAGAQTAPSSFLARTDYPTGELEGIVIADVNNDGIPDIVTSELIVFLGNGDGTFRPVTHADDHSPSNRPEHVMSSLNLAVADVNGDGFLDAVSTSPSNTVYVSLGNGDGTFQTATIVYTDVNRIYSVVIADLNHDGHPDIIAGGTGISMLTNNGDGSFHKTADYLSGKTIGGITVQDINGDHLPDIAVGVGSDIVQFLLGKIGGGFRTGPALTTPTAPGSLFFADFNGDGLLDLAVGGSVWVKFSSQVTIFPGTGSGSFGSPYAAFSFPAIGQIAVGDVNQDGHPDIVAIEDTADAVAVYINKGDGTFGPPRHYSAVAEASDVAITPLHKAGLDDIVVAGDGPGVSVLLNEGTGSFQDGLHIPLSMEPGQTVTADFNHDGLDDIAATTPAGVQIFLATGQILAPFSTGATVPSIAHSLIEGDFNSDGIPDLAMGLSTNQIAIVFGKGDGTFSAPVYTAPGGVSTGGYLYIWAGDFNGDGKLDLATSFNSYLLGNGDGTFQTPSSILPPKAISIYGPITAIGAGDLNADGVMDMIVSLNADSAYVFSLLGSRRGALTQVGPIYSYNFGLIQIIIADVSGDGIPDAVVGSVYGAGFFEGTGGGILKPTAVELGNPPITTYAIAVADFNNDSIPDIAVSTDGESSIALYTGIGRGSFSGPAYLGTAPGSTWVVQGHFHGTRTQYPDLAVPAVDGIDILLNTTK